MNETKKDIKINKFIEQYCDNTHTHTHTHTPSNLLDALKQVVPHFFKDGIFDRDAFLHEFDGSSKNEEKYGLSWHGKNQAIEIANSPSINTLKPNKEKSLNFDESENIIISGDNLEVLKILQKSYSNKVDVIYIDPPYNTGNDFIYKDKFQMTKKEYDELIENFNIKSKNQQSSVRYHTNWLNMIYSRLKIARNLLKEDGIILISIDDNEQSRLKLICDEIFGEQNFVVQFVWQHKLGGGNDQKFFIVEHEYILMYTKNINDLKIKEKKVDTNIKEYNYEFENKFYKLIPLVKWGAGENESFKTLRYSIIDNNGNEYWPTKPNGNDGRWRKKPENCDFIVWKENNKKINTPYEAIEFINSEKIVKEKSILFNTNVGTTSDGTKLLCKILNYKIYQMFPKSLELIKYLINLHTNKNSIVLDFFAGSGTTGQAVMELNKEDDGNRKYILVQLPEKLENSEFQTITDITRERIKKSIEMYGYKEKGFKYYELNSSNLSEIDNSDVKNTLFDKSVKENRTSEELLTELMLKIGLDLNTKMIFVKKENISYWIDESKSNVFYIEKIPYDRNVIDETFYIWKNKNEIGTLNIFFRSDCFTKDSLNKYIKNTIVSFSDDGNITWTEI